MTLKCVRIWYFISNSHLIAEIKAKYVKEWNLSLFTVEIRPTYTVFPFILFSVFLFLMLTHQNSQAPISLIRMPKTAKRKVQNEQRCFCKMLFFTTDIVFRQDYCQHTHENGYDHVRAMVMKRFGIGSIDTRYPWYEKKSARITFIHYPVFRFDSIQFCKCSLNFTSNESDGFVSEWASERVCK